MSTTTGHKRMAHQSLWRKIRRRVRFRPFSWISLIPHLWPALAFLAWSNRDHPAWTGIADGLWAIWLLGVCAQALFLLPATFSTRLIRVRTQSSSKPFLVLALLYQCSLIVLLGMGRVDVAALAKYAVGAFVQVNRQAQSPARSYVHIVVCLAAVVFIGLKMPLFALLAAALAVPTSWFGGTSWETLEALPSKDEYVARWLDSCDIGGG